MIVYVASGRSSEITALVLHEDSGRLETLQRIALRAGVTPLTVSPDLRFLYAGLRAEPPAVGAFAIAPLTGLLTPLGYTPLPDAPMYLATDTRGHFLFCASYAAASFTISRIRADGGIDVPPIQHTQTPPHAHAILADPTNRFVYVTSLGGDMILQYVFDASTGRAQPNAAPFVTTPRGSGPRHLAFHPQRPILYANGELNGGVYSFALDSGTGRLQARDWATMLAATSRESSWAAELAVTPDGRYLYTSDRRTNSIAVFDVSGESASIARQTIIATEEQPRTLAIDPRGRWLIVAGEKSNYLAVYRIDAATGALAPFHRFAVAEKPVWISIVDLPSRAANDR